MSQEHDHDPRRLIGPPRVDHLGCAYEPEWSPDGRSIGFIQVDGDELGHLWFVGLSSGQLYEIPGVNLGDSKVWYSQPVWDWR